MSAEMRKVQDEKKSGMMHANSTSECLVFVPARIVKNAILVLLNTPDH